MTIEEFLEATSQYTTALSHLVGHDEASARLQLVKELLARVPHKYLLAATKEEIQAAGRSMVAEGHPTEVMKDLQSTVVGLLDHVFQRALLPYHPIRGLGDPQARITEVPHGALAVGLEPEHLGRVREILEPTGAEVHAEPSDGEAADKLGWFPFALVLCKVPLPNLDTTALVDTVRGSGSLCRAAGLVLLPTGEEFEPAGQHLGHGANRVVALDSLAELLPGVITELGTVSERTKVRVMVRAVLEEGGRSQVWQSDNVSITGMLVRTPTPLPTGGELELEFSIPGDESPIRTLAEVVRCSSPGREDVRGLGLRFLSFEGDGQYRLELFLRSDPGS